VVTRNADDAGTWELRILNVARFIYSEACFADERGGDSLLERPPRLISVALRDGKIGDVS
jgi:hypothetical protein